MIIYLGKRIISATDCRLTALLENETKDLSSNLSQRRKNLKIFHPRPVISDDLTRTPLTNIVLYNI